MVMRLTYDQPNNSYPHQPLWIEYHPLTDAIIIHQRIESQ